MNMLFIKVVVWFGKYVKYILVFKLWGVAMVIPLQSAQFI